MDQGIYFAISKPLNQAVEERDLVAQDSGCESFFSVPIKSWRLAELGFDGVTF
jgi:hypothetical protein